MTPTVASVAATSVTPGLPSPGSGPGDGGLAGELAGQVDGEDLAVAVGQQHGRVEPAAAHHEQLARGSLLGAQHRAARHRPLGFLQSIERLALGLDKADVPAEPIRQTALTHRPSVRPRSILFRNHITGFTR